jgi:hypothetical protein
MRVSTVLCVAVLTALAGCAAAPAGDAGSQPSGGTFLSIVGTPFLIAFKIPFCVASVAIAAPLAGVAALSPDEDSRRTQQALGAGLAQNCGPPYVVSP